MSGEWALTTILVVECEGEPRDELARELEQEGYLILRCFTEAQALEYARVHSRPIQFLLTDSSPGGRSLSAKLSAYRAQMRTLFLSPKGAEGGEESLTPDQAVRKLRTMRNAPASTSMGRAGASQ